MREKHFAKCHPERENYSQGYCKNCWCNYQYKTNPEYREKFKARVKKSQDKKRREDPEWNAERQRKWRKENPDKYNFLMCKSYWKKLSPEDRERLMRGTGK